MSKTTTTFNAFRASGAELRNLASKGYQPAQDEIKRRASSGKGGYVRSSLRAGVKPACWARAEPEVFSREVERKLRTKGVMSAMLQSLKEGVLTPPSRPEPALPKAPRDTIAAVRKDMARLAESVDALAKAVSARMVA